MNEARLIELAEAYGADLQRWPASERLQAERLLLTRPALRAWLAPAAELDEALTQLFADHDLSHLQARVLAAAGTPRQAQQGRSSPGLLALLWQELGGFRLVAPTMAVAMALGLGLSNWFDPSQFDSAPTPTDLASLALLDTDDEELLP